MTVQQFLSSEAARRRYWVGSHLGWRAFAASHPNGGHEALAALERAGVVTVSSRRTSTVCTYGPAACVSSSCTARCVVCSARIAVRFDRRDLAVRVEHDNPWITIPDAVELGPTAMCCRPPATAS
jgi:hypothetical protein